MCFDKRIELDFSVQRNEEFFDIVDDGLGVEILGDTAAHSANRFKGVFKGFDWCGVILWRDRVM